MCIKKYKVINKNIDKFNLYGELGSLCLESQIDYLV